MNDFLYKKLAERAKNGALRALHTLENKIDFCSNDYLGLSSFEIETFDKRNSGEGSRLIAGSSSATQKAEETLAKFFDAENALMFNSGYDANLGLFSSISTKNTLILYDEYIHASVRDGIRLGIGKSFHFKHNDFNDLERLIESNLLNFEAIYVAIESLYSMGGDVAPIAEFVDVCKKFKVHLIVDEAHAGGVFGLNGKGIVFENNVQYDVFARIFTFGKGFGSHGACVLGSITLKKYLINFARSFIYTTALPASAYERIDYLFQNHESEIESNRKQLQGVIQYFIKKATFVSLSSAIDSPIQIAYLNQFKTKELLKTLSKSNLAIKPIFSPTVPKEKECLRICLHAFNKKKEVDELCEFLKQHCKSQAN